MTSNDGTVLFSIACEWHGLRWGAGISGVIRPGCRRKTFDRLMVPQQRAFRATAIRGKNKKAGLASGLSGVLVERMGIEPTTSSLRTTRSPS